MYNKGRPIIITSVQINPILLRPIAWPEGVAPTASLRLREGIFFFFLARKSAQLSTRRGVDPPTAPPPATRELLPSPAAGEGAREEVAERSRAGGHGHDARRAGAGQDAGGHGGRRGVRAAAPRGAVLLRRHQPQLHPQHHPEALRFRDLLGCRPDVHLPVNDCFLQSGEIWGNIHPWQLDGAGKVHSKLLTLLAIILEFGALVWYSLSYIPFARSIVSKVMTSCFDTDF